MAWLTVGEASRRLGVSTAALRMRKQRGSIRWMLDDDGHVRYWVEDEPAETLPAVRPMLTPIVRVELDAVVDALQAAHRAEIAQYEQRVNEWRERALRAEKRPWWRWWG